MAEGCSIYKYSTKENLTKFINKIELHKTWTVTLTHDQIEHRERNIAVIEAVCS